MCVMFVILDLSQRYSDFVDNNIDSVFCGWSFRDCVMPYSDLCLSLSPLSFFFSLSLSPLSLTLSVSLSLSLSPFSVYFLLTLSSSSASYIASFLLSLHPQTVYLPTSRRVNLPHPSTKTEITSPQLLPRLSRRRE